QQQVAHPVLVDQVAGQQPAQRAGTTGDQHGALRVQPRRGGGVPHGRGGLGGGEAGGGAGAGVGGGLGCAGGRGGGGLGGGGGGGVEVDEGELVRVFGLRAADQAPDRGVGQVGGVVTGVGGYRLVGHDDQPAVG